MTGPRDSVQMGPPRRGLTLDGYPEHPLDQDEAQYRCHRLTRGPWFFDAEPQRSRFNISTPHGTCYVASEPAAAARESIGEDLIESGYLTRTFLVDRFVSELPLPESVRAADITADGMAYGVVGDELSSAVTFEVSNAWAQAFADAGFGGLWYLSRYSVATDRCLALFGPQGPATGAPYQRDPAPVPLSTVVAAAMPAVKILDVPTSTARASILHDPKP